MLLTTLTLGQPQEALAQPTEAAAESVPDSGVGQGTPPPEPQPVLPKTTEESGRNYLALAQAPAFLAPSYLYWGTPVGAPFARTKLVFALEYALHLPAFSNLRRQALWGKAWAGAVTLTFEGALRMFALPSKPVRMPSYRPSLSGQLFYIWRRERPVLFGVRLGLFHYSNGQEGCTFDARLKDGTEACVLANAAVQNPQHQLNRTTGNFATNGWLLQLDGRVHRVNVQGVAVGHLHVGGSAWVNLQRTGLRMDPSLQRWYGWGRLGFYAELRQRVRRSAIATRAQAYGYPGSGPGIPKAAGLVELEFDPYWLSGFGFFARYYGGRDFYNAFFVDKLQQFAVGLTWQGEQPLRFKPSPPVSPLL